MCDTFVAVSNSTSDSSVIFGKNSDRQPNEPQEILHIKGRRYDDLDAQECTYIKVPQVEETYSMVISKPSWIWGAEMGMNEFGVTIGNEAVWTIFDKENREERLLGMDMLRLALERSKSAEEALSVITTLLSAYGQGGNCGFDVKEYYDNSFIIADPQEAWVLETAGRYWIAEKVENIRSISNTLTIENKFDKIHPELLDYAIDKGLCDGEHDFNFKQQFSDKFNIVRIGAKGDDRAACTYSRLQQEKGSININIAFETLRDHNTENADFNPRKSSMKSPCLHASSLLTPSQSTSSMVGHIKENESTAWVTATSAPCISIFKPMDPKIEVSMQQLPKTYEPGFLWWEHEYLHRQTLVDYQEATSYYLDEFRQYEQNLIEKWNKAGDSSVKAEITKSSFNDHLKSVNKWQKTLQEKELSSSFFAIRYRRYWDKLSEKAEITL